MTDAELMVRASIQVFLAKADYPKPEGFGSCCVIVYQNRRFFISVSHVTDAEGYTTFLETNQPFDKRGPIIQPIGGICYFDQIKVTKDMSLEDFESVLQQGKRLDIAFAEIKHNIELLQPEMDFKAFKVEASTKLPLFMEDATMPTKDERYGFFGKVRHSYNGIQLSMIPTLKHSLKFHRTKGEFYMFLAPQIISDSEDYEGCSGAPILDSQCRIVALACAVHTGTRIIYGFPIQKCKELLDYALQTRML
jgi:hypothetical protein